MGAGGQESSNEVLILIVMEDGHWLITKKANGRKYIVLILIVMEDGHWHNIKYFNSILPKVLILIVMEDGHWHTSIQKEWK